MADETKKVYSLEVTEQEAVELLGGRVSVKMPRIFKAGMWAGVAAAVIGIGALLFAGENEVIQGVGLIVVVAGIAVGYVFPMVKDRAIRLKAGKALVEKMHLVARWPQSIINERLIGIKGVTEENKQPVVKAK